MSVFIPITKVDAAQRLVYGTLTEEIPDKAGEILDYASARPAFEEWSDQFRQASGGKSFGNVRAMHSSVAAGKLTGLSFDDEEKRIEGVAKIVDDDEWQKVLEGVYTGFSIGGGYARRWPDPQNPQLMRYTPVLSEVSLVDNPAVPTATFELIKQDGTTELCKFVRKDDAPAMAADDGSDSSQMTTCLQSLTWLRGYLQAMGADRLTANIDALQQFLNGDDVDEENELQDEDTEEEAAGSSLAMVASIGALQKRIAELEAQPLPAKGVLRVVNKSDDRVILQEEPPKTSPQDRVHELMKIALSNPIAM